MRGASVAEITNELRTVYGRAYRRADLLVDIRSYRGGTTTTPASVAISSALATYRDMRGLVARIGVAAFSISLLLPTIVHGGATRTVMLAGTVDANAIVKVDANAIPTVERITLPNAREIARVAPTVTPEPTPVPTVAPTPAAPLPPVAAALPNGQRGVVVTASWYGPGFYDNRLPCWQWLQANGLPIQFEADTWGVAHKALPCGTMLTLSHGPNVITVPVVDRGPYIAGRELDLSLRVKSALGCTDLCTVVMHIGQ